MYWQNFFFLNRTLLHWSQKEQCFFLYQTRTDSMISVLDLEIKDQCHSDLILIFDLHYKSLTLHVLNCPQ
jgi:hypothetical protein